MTYSLLVSLALALVLLWALGTPAIVNSMRLQQEFAPIVATMAVAQAMVAFTNHVVGVASGLGSPAIFAKVQISASFLTVPVAWLLIVRYGLAGGAAAIIASYVIGAIPAFYYFRSSRFWRRVRLVKLTRTEVRSLGMYTLMLLTSAGTFPIVEAAIRELLIGSSGYQQAGIWQGGIRLSNAYLGLFGVFLAHYLVPAISAARDKMAVVRITLRLLGYAVSIFAIGASFLYAFRDFILPLLLSHDFLVLGDIIGYQLVGDIFRLSSYVLGAVAIAKAAGRLYIAAEIIQSALWFAFAGGAVALIGGAKGAAIGYMMAYLVYLIVCGLFFLMYSKSRSVSSLSC